MAGHTQRHACDVPVRSDAASVACVSVCDVASGSDKLGLSCEFIGFLVFNLFFPSEEMRQRESF